MKLIIATVAFLLAGFSNLALANCNVNNTYLTEAQVGQLLFGRTVCARVASGAGRPGWNESHAGSTAGGAVTEYHDGKTESMGTWSTGTQGGRGRVIYTQGSSVSTYEIAAPASCSGSGAAACVAPGNFQYCAISGTGATPAILNVQVTVAPANLASCSGSN